MSKQVKNEDGEVMVEIKLPVQLDRKEQSYADIILKWQGDAKKAYEVISSCLREHRLDVIMWLAQNGVEIPLELADQQLHAAPILSTLAPPEASIDGIPPLTAQDLL